MKNSHAPRSTLRQTLLALLLLITVALTAWSSTLWEGSLTTVNNTTVLTSSNTVAAVSIQGGNYVISYSGMNVGSNLTVNLQQSLDGTNFGTVASWTPSATNASTVPWTVGGLQLNVWQRFQIVTVGSIGVGILQP